MAWIKYLVLSRWERLWYLVDQQSVVVNQMLFYALICINGFFSIATVEAGSQAMQRATSPGYYLFWCWVMFLAPLMTMLGKALRGGWSYTGLWLQLGGDCAMWMVFISYVAAVVDNNSWSTGSFAGTLALCCLLGTPVFIMRDVRKLRQVEAQVKEGEG